MKRLFSTTLAIFACAAVLCGCGGRAGSRTRSEGGDNNAEYRFRMVEPPMQILEENRFAYMREHYWDRFDFRDTVFISKVDTLEMIRAYAAFVATFVGPVDGEPIAKLMERASTSRRMLDYFVMLSDRILNDPNSPLRSSELYIPVLQAQIRSPFYDRYEKLGPEYDLNLAMQNRIGKRANDFEYTLASGRRGTLYGLKADYVLLFINNPGCPMCKMLEEQLSASALVSDMVASGRLKVLALYPDEDLDAWRSYAHLMPKGWINAYDDGCKVRDGEIYDLRAIPSMYLLDAEKKVLIKDSVSAVEIENALSGR